MVRWCPTTPYLHYYLRDLDGAVKFQGLTPYTSDEGMGAANSQPVLAVGSTSTR